MIKELITNVKGESRRYSLGRHTLIVGPNEAGKSAIADSLRLLWFGDVAGILFRKGISKAAGHVGLLGNGGLVRIQGTTEAGDTLVYELEPGKRAKHVGPKDCGVDIEAIREAFSGSDDRALRFIAEGCRSVRVGVLPVDRIIGACAEGMREELRKMLCAEGRVEIHVADLWKVAAACMDTAKTLKESISLSASIGKVVGAVAEGRVAIDEARRILFMAELRAQAAEAKRTGDMGRLAGILALESREKLLAAPSLEAAQKVYARAVFWDTATTMNQQAAAWIAEADQWKKLADWLIERAGIFVKQRLVPVVESMAMMHMPENEELVIHKDLLIPMVKRCGRIFQASSGSTEARLLATLALSMPSVRARLIIFDDRMWDTVTLGRLLRALDKAPCQIVLMSTVMPKGRWRGEWEVLELEERREGVVEESTKRRAKPEEPDVVTEKASEILNGGYTEEELM